MSPVILSPLMRRLLQTTIFLFIPLAIMAPHAVVWELVLGGLIAFSYSRKSVLEDFPKPLKMNLLAIPVWGLITTLWAQHPFPAFVVSLKIGALVILGIFWCRLMLSLSSDIRQSLIYALLMGLFLGIFLLLIDLFSGNAWQAFWEKTSAKAFAQGSLMISLAYWPATLWILRRPFLPLWGRFSLVTCLFALIYGVLYHIDCDTSLVGLVFGLVAFLGFLGLPRVASWGMRLVVPLVIVVFPFLSLYALKPAHIPTYNQYISASSYVHRLYIWHETATVILEYPWKGLGMDGTRYHEKAYSKQEWSHVDKKGQVHKHLSDQIPTHPHNAILQLWLELGVMGFFLGILLAWQILETVFRAALSRLERAVSAGLFTGAFLVVWVNLGFWQNWWIAGLWMMVGLTITLFDEKRERICC